MRLSRIVLLFAVLALVVAPTALALRFTDDSYLTPKGTVGTPYSHQFQGASGCGPDPNVPGSGLPYQYRILSGALPPGLNLSKSGLISGTPTQAGEYSPWIELSDEDPPSASWCTPSKAERQFTFTILQGLTIQQTSLRPTFTNEPYSLQLTATGGTPSWSIQSGALPAGVALGSNGVLSGTPTAVGDYTFTVKATDGSRTNTKTLTLTVVQRLRVTKPAALAAEVGRPFELLLSSTGGKGAHTWSVVGTLPAGLTLNPATGAISGQPTAVGSFPLKLTVTDTLGLTDSLDVTLTVAGKLTLTKKALATAHAGRAYAAVVKARGGVSPSYRLFSGSFPKGLRLNRKTGAISGTPTRAGTYRFRVQVSDKLGAVSSALFVLKVVA